MTNEERLHKLWQEIDKANDALIIARDMIQGIWNHGGFSPPERKEDNERINRLAESCSVNLRRPWRPKLMRYEVICDSMYAGIFDRENQDFMMQINKRFPNAEKMAHDQCLFLNESPAMQAACTCERCLHQS